MGKKYLFMNVYSINFKHIINSYRLKKLKSQKGYIGYNFFTILCIYNFNMLGENFLCLL